MTRNRTDAECLLRFGVPFARKVEAIRKGLRIRMGMSPAEIAEGAEVYWEGGEGTYIGAVFNNCLGQPNRYH